MEPFGLALEDFVNGNKNATVIFHRDDGLKDEYSISTCFRTFREFSSIEKLAITLCRGKILDIGAGVGPHSLKLQDLGFEIYSIDICPQACEIMRERDLKNVKCTTIYNIQEKIFDTFLLMGRSIGFVEDLKGLKKFLHYSKKLLHPDGIILLDSLDLRLTERPEHLAYQARNLKLGRYIGEIELQMEYKGYLGEPFKLLHVDPDTLNKLVQETGWFCNILDKEENGSYLAKIFNS
ncbi:hypothetical protein LCGC14_1078740 [marine sediment metagenome]|uniref:Methyltransferase domain-containing protein n=1 Tax=marine sediment metagenome TaxID=412755 RepID=A0A0F9N3J9_9ZZZZ